MQKADTEYLAREIASLRIALGEVATRDFLRSELARLAEELDEAAHRASASRQKAAQRAESADRRTATTARAATIGDDGREHGAPPGHAHRRVDRCHG